jgi:hypothetical protein
LLRKIISDRDKSKIIYLSLCINDDPSRGVFLNGITNTIDFVGPLLGGQDYWIIFDGDRKVTAGDYAD